MFVWLLAAFWMGGMVCACGHIAIELRRGLDLRTALIAHNHPFVYSCCLLAGVVVWPVTLFVLWERNGHDRASDDEEDDDDDDDSGDPEPEFA